jgi:hypothetical protein
MLHVLPARDAKMIYLSVFDQNLGHFQASKSNAWRNTYLFPTGTSNLSCLHA